MAADRWRPQTTAGPAMLLQMRRAILAFSFVAGLLAGAATIPMQNRAKQFFNLYGQKPPGFTHVVTSPPGKLIFVSGRGGSAPDGTMPQEFATQAKNTFEDLKRCLALAGATFKDV